MRFKGLWRHPDFMRLWTGQTISEFGSRITREGLPYAAVLTLAATPFQMGILAALGTVPVLLFGLIAGVWVDRLARRPILIATDIGRALLVGSIPVAALFGVLTIWQLYIVIFLCGVLTIFFEVAHQSYLPALVEREHVLEGNSKLSTTSAVAEIGGPALAGTLVQTLTAPIAMAFDALSFLASAFFIQRIKKPETPADTAEKEGTEQAAEIWPEIREGLQVILHNPILRSLAGCTAILNFFGSFFGALYLLYAAKELKLDPALVGILIGLGGVGAVVGSLIAERVMRRFGLGPTLLGAMLVSRLVVVGMPLAGGPIELVFLCMALPQLIGDGALMIFMINEVSLRQTIVPDRLLGRANASMHFLVGAISPVGPLIAGILAETIGLRPTVWIATIGMMGAVVAIWLSPIPKLREFPTAVNSEQL